MYKVLRLIIIAATLSMLAACCPKKQSFFRRKLYFMPLKQGANQHPIVNREPTLTIWIHGARPFGANTYNLGLKSPALFDQENYIAKCANTLIAADPIKFPCDHFLIYSWSGILDFKERQQAANILYSELKQYIENYKKSHKMTPKIRILAHSHGGNVALNLAGVPGNNLIIDELVLLAVPVQAKNKHFISNPLFKRIFSLYSTADYAQIIDPQKLYLDSLADSFFSGQRFKPTPNLLQVKTKINGTACKHLEFNDIPMLKILSPIIDQLNQWINELPLEILLTEKNRFMLSIYTNGRHTPKSKRYRLGNRYEHVEIIQPEI